MIKNLKKFLKKLGEALYKIFHWFGSGAERSGAKLQSQTSGKSYLVLSLNFFNYLDLYLMMRADQHNLLSSAVTIVD